MFRFGTTDLQASGCTVGDVVTLACLPIILQNIINVLVVFAGIVALFFIVWAGIKYTTSQGDTNKLDSARKTLTWAIIGLVFVIFSFFLLSLVGQITGVRQLPGGRP